MTHPRISRRVFLASAAALGCGRKKATGFPGYCFVANRGGHSIAAVDLDQFRVRKQIALPAAPAQVIAHDAPDNAALYALAPDAGAVYEIDPAALAIKRRLSAGSRAISMRLAPSGDALWILYREPAALVEAPLRSFRPGRRIRLAAPPDSFDLGEHGMAVAAHCEAKSISVISLARGAVERTIRTGAEPTLLHLRKDSRMALAASAPERTLTIFDVRNGASVVRLPLPLAPRRSCVTPDGGQLFLTGDGMDAVVIVFPFSTEIDQTVLAGHAPGAMTVTETSPPYLMVTNPDASRLTVLNLDTRRLVAVVQVGQSPGAIAITPDKQYALALNEKSGDMGVIRLATFNEAWVRRYKSASLFTMIRVGDGPVSAAILRTGA